MRERRIGLIVPSSNTTMERELPELLRRHGGGTFTFHSSRSRLRSVTSDELRRMVDDGGRCAAEVADADVDAIAYACLVALMAQGPGYHRTAERRLAAASGLDVPVVTAAGALIDGVRALGARRIAIVAPYMKPQTARVVAYIEAEGIEVSAAHSLEVEDNAAVGRIDPRSLLQPLETLDLRDADALVLSACVQCPSLPALEAAQERSGLPTLSAATATVFRLLESLGLNTAVPGAGALLDGSRSSATVTP